MQFDSLSLTSQKHTHLSSFSCDVKRSDLFVCLREPSVSVSSVYLFFVYELVLFQCHIFFSRDFFLRPFNTPSQFWFTVVGKICRYFRNNNERDVIEKKMSQCCMRNSFSYFKTKKGKFCTVSARRKRETIVAKER